ncbi:aldehyde dehydrogenase family protein [Effusibacillus pohliae]|uniref:aldehyde dehydrogenase family protein n=1 Tax=Effusibacillus pohliae TaxID=232270 RepID=UPI000372663C|nr:aldehyde dehydrogenase family protein [Effusibacillus pohliae]
MSNAYPSVSGQYLIGGEWIQASNVTNVHNPAKITEVVGEVALCSREDVRQAIDAAALAFQTWSRTPVAERANRMQAAADRLRAVIEEHVSLFVRENGKILVEAKKDLLRCVDIMSKAASALLEWWKPDSIPGDQKVQIRKRPRGVTAVISPWNSPMILTFDEKIEYR